MALELYLNRVFGKSVVTGGWFVGKHSNNNKPWERRQTLSYNIGGMVKSGLGSHRHRRLRGEKKKEKKKKKEEDGEENESLFLARAGLSSYLYRLCTVPRASICLC
jgi:hypothetical protein